MSELVVKSPIFCENGKILVLIGGWCPVYECTKGLNKFECYKCIEFKSNEYHKKTIKRFQK